MNATQRAEMERLALAVRKARQEARAAAPPSEEDRLIAAGWGDVDGLLIPAEVRRIAREGIGEVPQYSERPRKKAERKPVKEPAKSRWFAEGEKFKVLNRRKEEPLPVTREEILCDCWDDEPLLLDEQDEVDGGSRPA